MRAIVCKALGDIGDLVLEEVARPPLPEGGVRIAVEAAGLNFADTLIVAGKYQIRPVPPFSPGFEVAGRVLECAAGVSRCRPGDRVMAVIEYGGFAEEAVAPQDCVFVLAEHIDPVVAAGFPVAYGTSHLGLTYSARLTAGETLLVHGAAGGVGLTAVEIGKRLGARVIATAGGAEKLAVAAAAGADHVLDSRSEGLREAIKELTQGRGVDVVYDPVGGALTELAFRSLAWRGRHLVVGFAAGTIPALPVNLALLKGAALVGVDLARFSFMHEPAVAAENLKQLLAWFDEGRLKPTIGRVYPFAEAREALADILERRAVGKSVVRVG